VRRHIRIWQGSSRYQDAIERATRNGYTKRIVTDLKAQGLPPQLFYLALQESGLDAWAVGPETRYGIPKGMWQLIPDTAQRYGLRLGPLKNEPVPDSADDRHNWELATTAAVRYMKDIYITDAQGSGFLLIASYNWGEGRLVDVVRTMAVDPRERNFWKLLDRYRERIPAHTYNEVFSVISAAVIGENPGLFGFSFDNPLLKVGGR
jgi:soluble lytic murein transglycosylase-like protein